MKKSSLNHKANAAALNNNKGAQSEESTDAYQNPIDLVFDKLLLDMEENIEASPGEIIADGTIHRFDVAADGDKKGWYVCHFTEEMSYAFYGDWSEGRTYRWNSLKDTDVTLAQSKKLKSAMLEAEKIRNEARALEQSEATKKCMELWDALAGRSEEHTSELQSH